jgi:monofunctional glycosyltransferase
MLIRLAEGHRLRREWVAYERIAPALAEAVIAAEDNRSREQGPGFDFAVLRGQVEAWRDGERPRGTGTITMQTARHCWRP